ncbi:MAG: M56 family metallopeptidase [Gemmiger sp.]
MSALVPRLVRVSLGAGAAAVLVWVVCALLRRAAAPARLRKLLWLAVAVRFLCPVTLRVPLPCPPSAEWTGAAVTVRRYTVELNAALPGGTAAGGTEPVLQRLVLAVWVLGVLFLMIRAARAEVRLRRMVALACKTPDGAYNCAAVQSPFTLGALRPRIYLPETLTGADRAAVLLHERTHMRRGDALLKPLYYLTACLHWWNPLAWFAFRQFCREMEAACDEAATQGLTGAGRAQYCECLYRFAAPTGAPGALNFGGGSLKQRIAHILRYRKPTRPAMVCCVLVACLTAALCLAKPGFAEPDTTPAAQQVLPEETAEPEPEETAFLCPLTGYRYISALPDSAHRGIDLAADAGTPVFSSAAGTVTTTAYHYSMGYWVILSHGTDSEGHTWQTVYAHLLNQPQVAAGDTVDAGQQIGEVGSTGNSTGNHLHLELLCDGEPVNPQDFIDFRAGTE